MILLLMIILTVMPYIFCISTRCSVDPYLFENFDTVDGDRLMAKFRAFKFPDTTYVQFRSTVNACVDKCQGIKCSNGQIGYGRRKRDVMQSPEQNKVYEISKTTFIRVSGEPTTAQDEGMIFIYGILLCVNFPFAKINQVYSIAPRKIP